MPEERQEDMNTALLVEALITLIENAPILLALLSRSGQLSPDEVNLYRLKLKSAQQRLAKTWEDYLKEYQHLAPPKAVAPKSPGTQEEEDVNVALLIESLITLLEASPVLVNVLTQTDLDEQTANLLRQRIKHAQERLKTWEEYMTSLRR